MMRKKYHLQACLLLILVFDLTVLLTQASNSRLPELPQAIMMVVNTSISIGACWLLHARLKVAPPEFWPPRFNFWTNVLAGTVLLIAIDAFMELIVPKSLSINDPSVHTSFITKVVACLFLSLVCYIIFNNLFTNDMLQRAKLEVEQLKQASLQTQVMGLQQQLSPHFLFNSLSTLKGLANEPAIKEFIMQLSHIYRYLLDSTERQIVTLADELEFTRSFLYIQEKRFGVALKINLNIPQQQLLRVIPPLSLQLLIENAIKHNAFSHEQPLIIDVGINENNELVVRNNCRPNPIEAEGKGIGLQNIRERFQLLFKKDISINSSTDAFIVCLPLVENEDHYH